MKKHHDDDEDTFLRHSSILFYPWEVVRQEGGGERGDSLTKRTLCVCCERSIVDAFVPIILSPPDDQHKYVR